MVLFCQEPPPSVKLSASSQRNDSVGVSDLTVHAGQTRVLAKKNSESFLEFLLFPDFGYVYAAGKNLDQDLISGRLCCL